MKQNDWRTKALGQIRKLIKQADPKVVEEMKWKKPSNPAGVPAASAHKAPDGDKRAMNTAGNTRNPLPCG
jgi:hypothetical protein